MILYSQIIRFVVSQIPVNAVCAEQSARIYPKNSMYLPKIIILSNNLQENHWHQMYVDLIPLRKHPFKSGSFFTCPIIESQQCSALLINTLTENAVHLIGRGYEIESENRIQDKITNDEIIGGYKLILGAFCVLLAIIGIANAFSNTLGFLRQRKWEFARYISIGFTPEGIRKMFCIEALVIAGRPVLITLPLTIVVIGFMITANYLEPMEFIAVAPIVPILVFVLAVFGFVALAYYLGGKKVLKVSLTDALRDDTMM